MNALICRVAIRTAAGSAPIPGTRVAKPGGGPSSGRPGAHPLCLRCVLVFVGETCRGQDNIRFY